MVLRVPVLFGEVETVSESAVTCLWLQVQQAAEGSTLDHIQQRFPTDTRDVAAVCRKLAERARQVLGPSPVSLWPASPPLLIASLRLAGPVHQRNLPLLC